MLRDTITNGKELILTIYHVNPELDIKGRCWTVKEKIGRYNAIFEEKSVDMSFDEIINGVETEQMLLSAKETLSLCGIGNVNTRMTRIRNAYKPKILFDKNGTEIKIKSQDWICLCEFVKKYTGMDILRHAMSCGDIFLCEYNSLEFKKKSDKNISVLKNGYDRIEIFFKTGNGICDYQILSDIENDQDELVLKSKYEWDSFDIYAFCDNQLYFYVKDVIFMESVNFNINFANKRKIPLHNEYEIESSNSIYNNQIHIGNQDRSLRQKQDEIENRLYNYFKRNEGNAVFICKGQEEKVYNLVNNILNCEWHEIVFYDRYFNNSNKKQLIDWLRLLCVRNIEKINIVCGSGHAIAIEKIKNKIQENWSLSQSINVGTRIVLTEISEGIHDRFLLCRKDNSYSGLYFGTSVNSLNDNYYCIFRLEDDFAKECWHTLCDFIEKNKRKVIEVKNGN